MDQRKVNMLAREYCDAKKRRFKPVILSHPMMPGLLEVGPPAKLHPTTAIRCHLQNALFAGAWIPAGLSTLDVPIVFESNSIHVPGKSWSSLFLAPQLGYLGHVSLSKCVCPRCCFHQPCQGLSNIDHFMNVNPRDWSGRILRFCHHGRQELLILASN